MRKAKDIVVRVLASLPNLDQKRILKYWERFGSSEPLVCEKTTMEMLALGTDALAATQGGNFYFRYELLDDAPNDVLEAIVAHELAHSFNGYEQEVDTLYAAAEGVYDQHMNHPDKSAKRKITLDEKAERAADKVTKRWGFNIEKAKTWCAENYGLPPERSNKSNSEEV